MEPPNIVWIVQQLHMSTDHWSFCSCQSTRSWLTRCSLKVQITTNVIHIIHISQLFLKELWHEIHQNSNIENCRHIEWKMKITAQNIRRYKQDIKYKRRQLWRRLKRIGRVEINKSRNKIFWKLLSLTVCQSSFVLFVTFDIMPARRVSSTRSCASVIRQQFLY